MRTFLAVSLAFSLLAMLLFLMRLGGARGSRAGGVGEELTLEEDCCF